MTLVVLSANVVFCFDYSLAMLNVIKSWNRSQLQPLFVTFWFVAFLWWLPTVFLKFSVHSILGLLQSKISNALEIDTAMALVWLKLTGFDSLESFLCSGRRKVPGLRRRALPWTRQEELALKVDRYLLFCNAQSIKYVSLSLCEI